jgi:GNAT superfamily N-acetyltransferase
MANKLRLPVNKGRPPSMARHVTTLPKKKRVGNSMNRTTQPDLRQVQIAEADTDILRTYNVMRQLRPGVEASQYVRLVRCQMLEMGFRLASLTNDTEVICVAGFRICLSLGWGRYLYVDDLVTDERHRSSGAGSVMFDWLLEFARKNSCGELRLDSAVERHGAHRFYLRKRMDIACFNFRLKVESDLGRI